MIDYRAAFQIASPTSVSPAGKLQFSRQRNKNPQIPLIRAVFAGKFKWTAPRALLVSHFRQNVPAGFRVGFDHLWDSVWRSWRFAGHFTVPNVRRQSRWSHRGKTEACLVQSPVR